MIHWYWSGGLICSHPEDRPSTVDQWGFSIHAPVNNYGPHMLCPSLVYPSLNVPPFSVYSTPCSTEACSACTIWRNTYEYRHSPEGVLPTSTRVLLVQRGQPSCKGLLLLLGHLEANHGAIGRIDQRFNGFEGYSRGRGSGLHPRGGFCLVQLAKSAPRLLLVNRFAVLNVEKVNTDICEPIDAPLPSTLDRKALSQRPK